MRHKTRTRFLCAAFSAAIVLAMPLGHVAGSTVSQRDAGSLKFTSSYCSAPLSEEYKDYLAEGEVSRNVPPMVDYSYLSNAEYSAENQTFPSSYDLRKTGKSTPVYNQGDLSTCWAFAALAAAESGLVNRYPLINLSERHLTWFTYGGERENEFFGPVNNPYTEGGFNQSSAAILAQWIGPVSENEAPYSSDPLPETMRYDADWHMQDAFYLPQLAQHKQEERVADDVLKSIIMKNGAISVGFCASKYNDYLNMDTNAWYNQETADPDHMVTCIGWDDNYPKENFNAAHQPEHNGAWLIKNSWGVTWGEDGYFWLSFEDKSLMDGVFFNMEPADNYQNLYQYDLTGWGNSGGYDSLTAYAANIFTSERNEELDAVSFYTTDANTSYEIYLYGGLTDENNPTSGTLLTPYQTGEEEYAGYHTIELNAAPFLKSGEKFSVVVRFTNTQYPYPLAYEAKYFPQGAAVPSSLGKPGESFASEDGVSWEDMYRKLPATINDIPYDNYITNNCIKAFTNPVNTVTFSEDGGPIAYGSAVTLTAPGKMIHYTTDGSEPTASSPVYSSPIVIDRDMTIKAAAESGGSLGNIRQESYTQSSAYLSSITIDPDDTDEDSVQLIPTEDNTAFQQNVEADTVTLYPLGGGNITINDDPVTSGTGWTVSGLHFGANTIRLVSSADGKLPVTYTLTLYRAPIQYDYQQETITVTVPNFQLNTAADFTGETIQNGDSITPYINRVIYIKNNADGSETSLQVPNRYQFPEMGIDFVHETTALPLSDLTMYSKNPDMSDAHHGQYETLKLTPGETVYFQRPAGPTYFASDIVPLMVPARPAQPANPGIDYVHETTLDAIPSDVMVARHSDLSDAAYGANETMPVNPGENLYLYYTATDSLFCSLITELAVDTRQAAPQEAPKILKAADTSMELAAVNGTEYCCNDGMWQTSPLFTDLAPDTEYTFSIRMAADSAHFHSAERSVQLSTLPAESTDSSSTVSITSSCDMPDSTGTTVSSSASAVSTPPADLPAATGSSSHTDAPYTGDHSASGILFVLLLSTVMVTATKLRRQNTK